jgi:hypothetical protein
MVHFSPCKCIFLKFMWNPASFWMRMKAILWKKICWPLYSGWLKIMWPTMKRSLGQKNVVVFAIFGTFECNTSQGCFCWKCQKSQQSTHPILSSDHDFFKDYLLCMVNFSKTLYTVLKCEKMNNIRRFKKCNLKINQIDHVIWELFSSQKAGSSDYFLQISVVTT